MSVCTPCQPIENDIQSLEQQIRLIQSDPNYIQGPNDPHPGQPDPEMLREVKDLWRQVVAKQHDLDACLIAHCGCLPDLQTTVRGTATLSSPMVVLFGTASLAATARLFFHKCNHSTYDILSLTLTPSSTMIMFPITILGRTFTVTDTVSIGMNGHGSGTFSGPPIPEAMRTAIDLVVTHVLTPITVGPISWTPKIDPSTIHFDLSTSPPSTSPPLLPSPPGSPMDAAGDVTMGGSSMWMGGVLDKTPATLAVTGIVSPHP